VTADLDQAQFKVLLAAVSDAGNTIAPAWPLDKSIAVNPLWELRGMDIREASARFSALGGVDCLMPADHYRQLWLSALISEQDLVHAIAEAGADITPNDLVASLDTEKPANHWHNVADWLDDERDRQHNIAWRDEITHQISQFCAAFLQRPERNPASELYAAWLARVRRDRGIAILMDEPGLNEAFKELPEDPEQLLFEAFSELLVKTPEQARAFAESLLLDINGWASRLAYERWQSRLAGKNEDALPQLVAIRVGWELALWRHWQSHHPEAAMRLHAAWYSQLPLTSALIDRHRSAQSVLWIWQRAAELARQREERQRLTQPASPASQNIKMQAVFCIDVRSEIIRRALEAQSDAITTHGFAGFFGLPAAYNPVGTVLNRPQLPGLLAPGLRISEGGFRAQALGHERARHEKRNVTWTQFSRGASTAFSTVEAFGLAYTGKLLKRTFGLYREPHPVNDLATTGQWDLYAGERSLNVEEKAMVAGGMLKGLCLGHLAEVVMLVGHGSHTTNNPHAAGLDCGACGGQTGSVNTQVLAQLLNDPEVRAELVGQGLTIPETTRFVAAFHNTTTDDILCQGEVSGEIQQWLDGARRLAQRERAESLGLANPFSTENPDELDRAIRRRSQDWSEVRPEWGLAGNCAFIVAPRDRTRGISFDGRAFLHDYDASLDADFRVLEAIMTAPMIVTHWINMQYNTSVTDPLNFGSGNKVLHNVVGGNLGVFEGNGGDLRIGLPLQSVHDGTRWMHEPLRLSVYIEAPKAAISGVIERHEVVRTLVDNGWIHIFAMDDSGATSRWSSNGWED